MTVNPASARYARRGMVNVMTKRWKHNDFYQPQCGEVAKVIGGKQAASDMYEQLQRDVANMKPIVPKLVIIQVGNRKDSNIFINNKMRFAQMVGVETRLVKFGGHNVRESDIISQIDDFNRDKSVHGIIAQLPFDCAYNKHKITTDNILIRINPCKDVDGLHVTNAGKLAHGMLDNDSLFVPCTPLACMRLIEMSNLKLIGCQAVVIGCSRVVGLPMAHLLIWRGATVTVCHSKSNNIDRICREADLVVAAAGKASLVKASWLKRGAVVVDCGINVVRDDTSVPEYRLVGDVDFKDCQKVASVITPVPGGVGPLVVAMIISNTVRSALRLTGQAESQSTTEV